MRTFKSSDYACYGIEDTGNILMVNKYTFSLDYLISSTI